MKPEAANVVSWRLLCCFLIMAMSLGGIAVPLKLRQDSDSAASKLVLECLQFFTGGVFLGAGVVHMLPEAVEESQRLHPQGPLFWNPYVMFCLGYLVVWSLEAHGHPDTSGAVDKHQVLAMAQRAKTHGAAASVCVVDVPPVTTYHDLVVADDTGSTRGGGASKAAHLLSHQPPAAPALVRKNSDGQSSHSFSGGGSYGHSFGGGTNSPRGVGGVAVHLEGSLSQKSSPWLTATHDHSHV